MMRCLPSRLFAHAADEGVAVRRLGHLPERRRVDPDREHADPETPAEGLVAAVRREAPKAAAGHRVAEILRVERRLEADEIIGREAAHHEVVGRQHAREIGRRPGDVEEEPDPVGEAQLAQIGGERDEMVVVDPDHVVRPDELGEPPGEELVDAEIAGGVAPIEAGEVEPVVAHRPERPVGKAVVEILEVALGEIRNRVFDVAEGVRLGLGLASLHGCAGPAEPQPAALLQGRVEGDRKAAGIGRAGVRGHRHPVRDHDEAPSRPRNIRRRTHRLVMHRRYYDRHVPVRGLPALLLLPSSVMATPFTGFGCVLRGLRVSVRRQRSGRKALSLRHPTSARRAPG